MNQCKVETKRTHFKMYKAGKVWLFASVAMISLATGTLSGTSVLADDSQPVTATQSSGDQSPGANSTSSTMPVGTSNAQGSTNETSVQTEGSVTDTAQTLTSSSVTQPTSSEVDQPSETVEPLTTQEAAQQPNTAQPTDDVSENTSQPTTSRTPEVEQEARQNQTSHSQTNYQKPVSATSTNAHTQSSNPQQDTPATGNAPIQATHSYASTAQNHSSDNGVTAPKETDKPESSLRNNESKKRSHTQSDTTSQSHQKQTCLLYTSPSPRDTR